MSHLRWSEHCKWFDGWDFLVSAEGSKLWLIRVSYNKNLIETPESLEDCTIFTLILKKVAIFLKDYFYYNLFISSTITFLKSLLFRLTKEILVYIPPNVFSILFNSGEYGGNVNKTILFCFIRFMTFLFYVFLHYSLYNYCSIFKLIFIDS